MAPTPLSPLRGFLFGRPLPRGSRPWLLAVAAPRLKPTGPTSSLQMSHGQKSDPHSAHGYGRLGALGCLENMEKLRRRCMSSFLHEVHIIGGTRCPSTKESLHAL